jgi:glycopeptide antibiotics resistance protein
MHFLRYVPAIAWSLLLLYLSISPESGLPKLFFLQFPYSDKVLHLIFYAIFSILAAFSQKPGRRAYLTVFAIVFGFGCLIEASQQWVFTWRKGEILDIVANFTGTVAGLWGYRKIFK